MAGYNTCFIRVDFPEPLSPVTTTKHSSGISIFKFLRLFCETPFNDMCFVICLGFEIYSKFLLNINIVFKEDMNSENIKDVKIAKKVGRNERCPCGSGKKYKHCCGSV